jgi:hypothetical protein
MHLIHAIQQESIKITSKFLAFLTAVRGDVPIEQFVIFLGSVLLNNLWEKVKHQRNSILDEPLFGFI